MVEQKTQDQSEFNFGVSFTNRLNVSFYIIAQARREYHAPNWFNELLIIGDELSDDMNESQIKQNDNLIEKINPLIPTTTTNGKKHIDYKTFIILREYERFLRKICRAAGYKTKFKEDILEPEEEW